MAYLNLWPQNVLTFLLDLFQMSCYLCLLNVVHKRKNSCLVYLVKSKHLVSRAYRNPVFSVDEEGSASIWGQESGWESSPVPAVPHSKQAKLMPTSLLPGHWGLTRQLRMLENARTNFISKWQNLINYFKHTRGLMFLPKHVLWHRFGVNILFSCWTQAPLIRSCTEGGHK